MNELQIFNNEDFGEVRTVVIEGRPWFVAKDITECLGYQNGRDALYKHVDEEDKGVAKCDTLGGAQDLSVINESGLYSLILSSKLPEARKFKHWVTSEVLPTIRKTGGYKLPQSFSEALQLAADQAERIETLKKRNEELLPKAEFFDAVTDSKTAISIGETAKVLDAGIGQNKLFAFLRDNNILKSDNTPYQRYIDMGYFRVVEQKYEVNGEIRISIKTLVFQKGIDFIRRLLNKRGEL